MYSGVNRIYTNTNNNITVILENLTAYYHLCMVNQDFVV